MCWIIIFFVFFAPALADWLDLYYDNTKRPKKRYSGMPNPLMRNKSALMGYAQMIVLYFLYYIIGN